MAARTRKPIAARRHKFVVSLPSISGQPVKPITAWARVRHSKQPVVMHLLDEDALSSIKVGGVGNTQTCTMAHCTQRHSGSFPHPVLGMVDWQYSRCYIVTKLDRKTGLPSECVVYIHSDKTAKLNDSKGGQRKLLAELRDEGPRKITLRPARDRYNETRTGGSGRVNDGTRSRSVRGSITTKLQGAKLRHAVAQRGGV